MSINANDGLTKRIHPAGFHVVMVKGHPGVFYNMSGQRVGEEIAKQAGFNVASLTKERNKQRRIAEAKRRIEREFEEEEARIEREINAEAEENEGPTYTVKHRGAGKFDVIDPNGERVTEKAIPRAEAQALRNKMAEGAKEAEGNGIGEGDATDDPDAGDGDADPEDEPQTQEEIMGRRRKGGRGR